MVLLVADQQSWNSDKCPTLERELEVLLTETATSSSHIHRLPVDYYSMSDTHDNEVESIGDCLSLELQLEALISI